MHVTSENYRLWRIAVLSVKLLSSDYSFKRNMQRFVHIERQSLPFIEFFFPFNFIIRRILLIDQAGKKVEN